MRRPCPRPIVPVGVFDFGVHPQWPASLPVMRQAAQPWELPEAEWVRLGSVRRSPEVPLPGTAMLPLCSRPSLRLG